MQDLRLEKSGLQRHRFGGILGAPLIMPVFLV